MAEPYDASAAVTPAMGAALPPGNWAWGDQGDGTYTNPILPGDYSDLDAIRVGGDYYAISSTFQFSPGIIVLHSRDLVNWSIVGYVVEELTQIGPKLNWDAMDRYGKGIWALAIRYHNSKYWVYFCTPDEGLFMTTAASPAGPWAPFQQLFAWAGWDDCCPFWDDDGQGYLVATCFADGYKIHRFKLATDGTALGV